MKKQFFLAFALLCVSLVSCSKKDDPKPEPDIKGKFALTITEVKSSADVTSAYAMDAVTTAVITIEKGGVALDAYNNKEITLSQVNADGCVSKEIELEVGNDYTLTRLQLKNADGTVTFATPLTGSELAAAVEESLPIAITIAADVVKSLPVQVICTKENDVTQFGYATFNVTDKTE